jgi:hypothetical protein
MHDTYHLLTQANVASGLDPYICLSTQDEPRKWVTGEMRHLMEELVINRLPVLSYSR